MNKKQLITAWVTGLLICILVLFTPKIIETKYPKPPQKSRYKLVFPESVFKGLKWDITIQKSLAVLIIGGLLIYTLRGKKK